MIIGTDNAGFNLARTSDNFETQSGAGTVTNGNGTAQVVIVITSIVDSQAHTNHFGVKGVTDVGGDGVGNGNRVTDDDWVWRIINCDGRGGDNRWGEDKK